jgi:protein translocase SecG subunit
MFTLLLIIFILSIILLIPVILLQSGSGAQSGLMGNDLTMGAFGAKTSEVLVNFTKWLLAIFLTSAFILGWMTLQDRKHLTRQIKTTSSEQAGASSEANNAQVTPDTNIQTNLLNNLPQ